LTEKKYKEFISEDNHKKQGGLILSMAAFENKNFNMVPFLWIF